ncbi:ArnT family glycosyltransferase [Coxiella burnetii]|uniref:ArnT family glycosyltransferase n=1 Tax=Coxiella burnetii TaxID=777 RepID=UPI0021767651|nr:glycosyltransferase family 39 protein [Coxiella burnetii]
MKEALPGKTALFALAYKPFLLNQQWILPSIIFFSLLFKLSLFFICYHGNIYQIIRPDSFDYLTPAKTLLLHGNYGDLFERTPGYPTFITIIFALFGQHLTAIVIAQMLLSSLLIIEAYYIAYRLFSLSAAYLSAFLIAFNFLLLSYTLVILTELLFAIVIGFTFLIGTYLFSSRSYKLGLIFSLGLTLAFATFIRPISYYLIFPVAIGTTIYFIRNRFPWKKIIMGLLLLTAPSLVMVGGWQVRNKLHFNTFAYSNIMAFNLYWNYMGDIIQKPKDPPPKNVKALIEKLKEQGPLSPAEKTKFMAKTALAFLIKHPVALVKQMIAGFPRLMLGSDASFARFFSPGINYLVFKHKKQDLWHFRISKLLKNNSWGEFFSVVVASPMRFFLFFTYFFVAIALLTLFKFKLNENYFSHLFLLGCTLYFIILSSSAVSTARFRTPFELLIVIYASYGGIYSFRWIKRKFFDFNPHRYPADRSIKVNE